MVSIKFTTLLLGLFTTCFILVAALDHSSHGDEHRDDLSNADTDVASAEGVLTSVGESKILFRERKFLRDSKAKVDGSAYKINGDSKSSEKSSSLKSNGVMISHLNFQVKSALVGVSQSPLSYQNEPAGSQAKSRNEDEVQKFHNAASQLVNFLHKDYEGMDRPHRRPPVHNGEPFH